MATNVPNDADSITTTDSGEVILAYAGGDLALNDGAVPSYMTFDDNANDYSNHTENVTVMALGGDDDDTINNYGYNLTIDGGAGNDKISLVAAKAAVIVASAGNDTVYGFNETDTLNVDGAISNRLSARMLSSPTTAVPSCSKTRQVCKPRTLSACRKLSPSTTRFPPR